MSLAHSLALPLLTEMPPFALLDSQGTRRSGAELMGAKGLLVVFTCNDCPCARASWPRLAELARAFAQRGINTAAVNPNARPDSPTEGAESTRRTIAALGIGFPYLMDSEQAAAKAFGARLTPEPFLFDASRRLVYHGRFDSRTPAGGDEVRPELGQALEALATGRTVAEPQRPAKGCAISLR
jgi:peroxiredoxin